MTCPFLKEAQVKFCQAASVRKLIPLAVSRTEEKCSSPAFSSCPVYAAHSEAEPGTAACPHLQESLMQFCGAASVTRFIPFSESLLSRCGNDSFRYCELYLGMAHPGMVPTGQDGVATPDWLRYSTNHMWLDAPEDGVCHVGIDGFLSRAIGPVERVSYVWQRGAHRPAAVLTANGTDFEVVFPNPLLLTGCNLYLRADPGRLASEPYTSGWLFEGKALPETASGLMRASEAREWMDREQRRMNEFLQDGSGAFADGGLFAPGAARFLDHDRMRALFHQFFSPYASGKSEL